MGLLLPLLLLQATVGQQVCKEFDGVTTLQTVCDKVKDGDNITSWHKEEVHVGSCVSTHMSTRAHTHVHLQSCLKRNHALLADLML